MIDLDKLVRRGRGNATVPLTRDELAALVRAVRAADQYVHTWADSDVNLRNNLLSALAPFRPDGDS